MSEASHPEQIDRDYIRLLQMMRRFVKEEFGVSIHISREDAIAQLLRYADDSQNHVLKEMALELKEITQQVPELEQVQVQEKVEEEESSRYYRGAAIIDDKHAAQDNKPQEKPRPTRVYRGRVINS